MNPETRAYRQYKLLRVDRAKQLAEMREELTALGDRDGLQVLDSTMAAFRESGPQLADDPVGEALEAVARDMKEAMADLGAAPEVLDSVYAVATKTEGFSARMTRYTVDGSGIAIVADATLSLCAHYAEFMGLAAERGPEPDVLTGLLRYYNTQQRVFGKAGKLGIRLGPEGAQQAALLQLMAAQFVIGHELAHHVLGHPSSVSAFSPEEYLPVCSESQELETEADLHALRAVRRACERLFGAGLFTGREAALGAVGAVIAMLAVHVNERALYVRQGSSHPPARARAARLLREMNALERELAEDALRVLMAATEAASVFGPRARSFAPELLGTAPVHSPLAPSYLRTTGILDALQCRSRDWYVSMFEEQSREAGVAWPVEGARLAAEGHPAEALRLWGVEKARIGPLCDPAKPLTFHSLYVLLRAGFTARGSAPDSVMAYAVSAAMLAGEPLSRTG
uniref:IrrE N-terminal-like domain-containing protein n=1 Tax=Streptomyces sp. NBC_00049 TaxID=2903617 RepID=A0AAU2JJD4_9ACTN